MSVIPRGKIIGIRIDPATGKPMEYADEDHFITCEACGGKVDCRDLGIVFSHEGPLPHPTEDQIQ